MANKYWVGGTGNWDATTTNWSLTSGGAGGAAVPGSADVAIFDTNSNIIGLGASYTCTRTVATIQGELQFANPSAGTLTFAGTSQVNSNGNVTISSGVNWTHTGNLTFQGNGTLTTNAVTLTSNVVINQAGSTLTLGSALTTTNALNVVNGTIALNGFTATCNNLTSTVANTRSISFGSSAINITGNSAIILSIANATGFTYTGTPTVNCTYSGSVGTRTIQFGNTAGATETNVLNINVTAGSDTLGTTIGGVYKNLNFTGFTGTLSLATRTIYGNLTLNTGMVINGGTSATTFAATSGTQILTTNGITVPFPITQDGIGGTVQLGSALTLTSASATFGILTLTNGTFNANNYSVSVTSFTSNNSNTRTLTMGSGTWTLTSPGNFTIWNLATTTGLTFNKNTANITINASGSTTTKTFAGGGLTYNNLSFGGTSLNQTFAITGANTFAALVSTKTNAWTLTLPASTTTTVRGWSIAGTLGNVVTLNSSTAGTQATLTLSGGGVISSDYLSIQDSAATPSTTWYAGANSTNVSNNTGWIFTVPPTVVSNSNFFLLFA